MGERESYSSGSFCWVELVTSNAEAAKRFYSRLFGWEAEDVPAGTISAYSVMRLKGRMVTELYAPADLRRPHWKSYVAVENADESARLALDLGATLLAPAHDVLQAGRRVLLSDPTGAELTLWQPKEHFGAGLVNEPGAFCWNELATGDVEAAGRFYARLFGWEIRLDEHGRALISNRGRPNGSIRKAPEAAAGGQASWLVHFAVLRTHETLRRAEEAGALICLRPTETEAGRFALLEDPQGATFAVFEGDTQP